MISPTKIKQVARPSVLSAPHFTNRTLFFRVDGQSPTILYEARFVLDVYRSPKRPQKYAICAHTTKEEDGMAWEVKGEWQYFHDWSEVAVSARLALAALSKQLAERIVTAAYELEAMTEFREEVVTAHNYGVFDD